MVGEQTEAEKLRRMEERIEEVVLTSIIIIINTIITIITIISFFIIIPRLPHSVFSFKATNLDLMEQLRQQGRKSSRHDHHHLFLRHYKHYNCHRGRYKSCSS